MKEKAGKILIIDDDEDVLIAARLFLKQHNFYAVTDKDPQHIPQLLKDENFDVILLDMNFIQDVTSGEEGFFWLRKILEIEPSAVVILITAYGDVEMAVKAIKAGATDYVLKPWQNEKLLSTIVVAISLRRSRLEANKLKEQKKRLSEDIDQHFHDMIGTSSLMQQVFTTIRKVAETDVSVLILGENGTGKELVARALHRQSRRNNEVFIAVDMGAIPETLFEEEFFGHIKGTFTDAKESRAGRFEVASGGTLFLDEIGNVPFAMQAKLLKTLEDREITRLGSHKREPIDIRLICATNMPIYEMVSSKEFRQDLLYRINTVEIRLPPLRERREDIPQLVDHFIGVFAKKYKSPVKKISPGVFARFKAYNWPGNVRELKHAIERAVILSDSTFLTETDFFFPDALPGENTMAPESYHLETMEKLFLQKALSKYSGNITQAAKELGLTRTSLYRRMEKYGIK
ncbi:MAG: sigma-54-dependent Fis family transcriptional regulator [Spirochaetales bacterium]|nr:sigma-54-dependent Fis family transcriptional regulator [Spirochaetales bacterium]